MLLPSVLHTKGEVPYVFSVPLLPNHYYNLTIIARNNYGNASFSMTASKSLLQVNILLYIQFCISV